MKSFGPGKAGRPERIDASKPSRGDDSKPQRGSFGASERTSGERGATGKPGRTYFNAKSGAADPSSPRAQGGAAKGKRPLRLPPGPRGRALWLLNAVLIEGRTLSAALPEATAGLEASEAARAGRLATDTLRQISRADRLLSPFLRLKPTEPVMNLLRLATIELARGGAAHGVVHAAVSLSRDTAETQQAAGLVNAVLRRVSENLIPLDEMPIPTLPKALRKQLVAAWGKEVVAQMEAVFVQQPPVDLTARDGNGSALAAELGGALLPGGSTRLTEARQISALPGFESGAFWVQDAAAALPAQVLAVRPGERVLDLCAAPGGKTLQLSAAGAKVTALDLSAERMQRVAENLARTGLTAELVVADALLWPEAGDTAAEKTAKAGGLADPAKPGDIAATGNPLSAADMALFDAILLDAPCSATGTIRRHPDLPHLRAEAELAPLLELQARLIDRAFSLLRPGGRLVFCTCSLLPAEGEAQAEAALARLPGLRRDPAATAALSQLDPEFHSAPGELRTRPELWAANGGIDGFYIGAFRKAGPEEEAEADAQSAQSAADAAPALHAASQLEMTEPVPEQAEPEFALDRDGAALET